MLSQFRPYLIVLFLHSLTACTPVHRIASEPDDFGVLVMAHGGRPQWNAAVLDAVKPLAHRYPVEVAFGMADAMSLQEGVSKLEARGVQRIGVVRLFISGESWYERTRQILGLTEGAPPQPVTRPVSHEHHGGHRMEFWRVESTARFALSHEGLAEAESMGQVLADRVLHLSTNPRYENVLILAHGPGDDEENAQWLAHMETHADNVRQSLPFRQVRVDTLREDWPEKRQAAERRIRGFVEASMTTDANAIVVPFRVHGFGPYADVLQGLNYVADGRGLLPHPAVKQWILQQAEELRRGTFQEPLRLHPAGST